MIRRPPRSPLFPSPTLFRSSKSSRPPARLGPLTNLPPHHSFPAGFSTLFSLQSRGTFSFRHPGVTAAVRDRKSTRLNSSHLVISYAVFCLKKKKSHKHQLSV